MTLHGGPDPIIPVVPEELSSSIRLGLVRAEPVLVRPSESVLLDEIRRTAESLAAQHAGRQPAAIPGLGPARDLYRSFGIDPTRTRPSSEALLRRVLQHKPFPRILNAVDWCNHCALQFLLPIGLYDTARIRGEVVLRKGVPGESYPGIRKDAVHLEGKPVLADSHGPFGNPTSDSLRTSVTSATQSLWMVIFAPAGLSRALLDANVRAACESAARHLSPPGIIASTSGIIAPRG